MKNTAFREARNRPKKPPKKWKKNKGKCRLRCFPSSLYDCEGLIFYCTKKSHWHGYPHPIRKSIRRDDIFVVRDELYSQMVK